MDKIDRYLRIPYVDQGRTSLGVDCWGLVCLVYADKFGITLPSYAAEYETAESREVVARAVQSHRDEWSEVRAGDERSGDVALFWISKESDPSHVGIVIGGGRMLTIMRKSGVSVERYWSSFWARRLVGLFRHPGLA